MFDLTLSFDNGPEPHVTPHVLDTFDRATGRRRPLPAGISADCVPIRSGEIVLPITPFVSTIEERFAP